MIENIEETDHSGMIKGVFVQLQSEKYRHFFIRTNFIRTTRLKLKAKTKTTQKMNLRTFWWWEVQKEKLKIMMIYISFQNSLTKEWHGYHL